MDRRQFLVGLGRAGLAAGLLAAIDACGSPAPTALSGLVGPKPSATPAVPPGPRPFRSPTPVRDNRIVAENRRPGDRGWDLSGRPAPSTADVFTAAASVAAGDALDLHVANRTAADVDWYRLGWYDRQGGRLVRRVRGVPAAPPSPRLVDPLTGRVEAAGGHVLTTLVDAGWPSGLYLAIVRPTIGPPTCAPFVVRPPLGGDVAPVLFVCATTTWQAYNDWGGADLYAASAIDRPLDAGGRRAVQVSYDRPHLLEHGAGLALRWELDFVRWQEREGRDVDYCADVDLELHPEVVAGRRLILFVGHHEYWSRPMRTTIETAIASGTNVAFLAADDMAWQVRFEASPLGPARRMTCYKSSVLDPLAATQPELTTCRWRETPVNDPEAVTIGQMYGHVVARVADWVAMGTSHWLYEGTGMRDRDRIRNLVGQEYDTFYPSLAPPGTTILAQSPVDPVIRQESADATTGPQPLDARTQTATAYTAASGATVIAAGTFQWSWALDTFGDRSYLGVTTPPDARVARMTRNILDRLGDGRAVA
jgi:N,N-dimethylformamidase beta subunit-like protein